MINKDKIFELFSSTEEQEYNEDGIHIDFMDDSYIKVGMFIKLIQNNKVFQAKLKKFFDAIGKEFDEETTKESSEFTTFNRAWFYIKAIDIEIEEHLNSVIKHDTPTFLDSLEKSIKFFEAREEYKRCAHLFKIQAILKEI